MDPNFAVACTTNRIELFNTLMSKGTIDPSANQCWALITAAELGHESIVECLINDKKIQDFINDESNKMVCILSKVKALENFWGHEKNLKTLEDVFGKEAICCRGRGGGKWIGSSFDGPICCPFIYYSCWFKTAVTYFNFMSKENVVRMFDYCAQNNTEIFAQLLNKDNLPIIEKNVEFTNDRIEFLVETSSNANLVGSSVIETAMNSGLTGLKTNENLNEIFECMICYMKNWIRAPGIIKSLVNEKINYIRVSKWFNPKTHNIVFQKPHGYVEFVKKSRKRKSTSETTRGNKSQKKNSDEVTIVD